MSRKLSASLEDYLEAIADLSQEEGHAHSKEIAQRLGVKMPSVTEALRQLVDMGYIIYNVHYPVQLTATGKTVAMEILTRHRVLTRFFIEILGLSPDKAADTACHLEHVVDSDTIERFVIFSDAITKRSDARALQVYLTEAMSNLERGGAGECCVLSDLAPDEAAVVERFSRNLNAPHGLGLKEGDTVALIGVSLDKSVLKLNVGGKALELPAAAAENIWVRRKN